MENGISWHVYGAQHLPLCWLLPLFAFEPLPPPPPLPVDCCCRPCFGTGGCKYSCRDNPNTSIRSSLRYAKQPRIKLCDVKRHSFGFSHRNPWQLIGFCKRMYLPLPHSKLWVCLKTAPRSLSILCFLLESSLEIDYDRMAFFRINIDRILRLRSKHQLLRKFLVDFYQRQSIPVVGTCIWNGKWNDLWLSQLCANAESGGRMSGLLTSTFQRLVMLNPYHDPGYSSPRPLLWIDRNRWF